MFSPVNKGRGVGGMTCLRFKYCPEAGSCSALCLALGPKLDAAGWDGKASGEGGHGRSAGRDHVQGVWACVDGAGGCTGETCSVECGRDDATCPPCCLPALPHPSRHLPSGPVLVLTWPGPLLLTASKSKQSCHRQ